jgi:hypothetical protein
MADLPELSEPVKRILAIKLANLLEGHRLNGDHLNWHDRERKRLRCVQAQLPEKVSGGSLEGQEDHIGINVTLRIAEARFSDLVEEYLPYWSPSAGWDVFAEWPNLMKCQVLNEVAVPWKVSSDALDRWFDRACQPAVERALDSLIKGQIGEARAAELKRLKRDTRRALPTGSRASEGSKIPIPAEDTRARTNPARESAMWATNRLSELPEKLQNAFEAAKARAKSEYATRAQRFPSNPQFADSPFHLPVLIHTVFLEFCAQARLACRDRHWTPTRVGRATDAMWPLICDFYLVRERGACSDEQKSRVRTVYWHTVTDDQRWKEHLSELAAMAERGSNPAISVLPELPRLSLEAAERIRSALDEAKGLLRASGDTAAPTSAVLLYFDAIAWEYMCTRTADDFEALIPTLSEHGGNTLAGELPAIKERQEH